jgi:hypothetical protein
MCSHQLSVNSILLSLNIHQCFVLGPFNSPLPVLTKYVINCCELLSAYCVKTIIFGSTGFELRTLHFLGRCSTTWHTTRHFCSVISQMVSHFLPRPTWTVILLFYASHYNWDIRHTPPHPAFLH